jgi:methylphosphotriester-DNA--protein-cysteine methyltransferase
MHRGLIAKQEQRSRENRFDGAFVRVLVVRQTDVPCKQICGNKKGARPRILKP